MNDNSSDHSKENITATFSDLYLTHRPGEFDAPWPGVVIDLVPGGLLPLDPTWESRLIVASVHEISQWRGSFGTDYAQPARIPPREDPIWQFIRTNQQDRDLRILIFDTLVAAYRHNPDVVMTREEIGRTVDWMFGLN